MAQDPNAALRSSLQYMNTLRGQAAPEEQAVTNYWQRQLGPAAQQGPSLSQMYSSLPASMQQRIQQRANLLSAGQAQAIQQQGQGQALSSMADIGAKNRFWTDPMAMAGMEAANQRFMTQRDLQNRMNIAQMQDATARQGIDLNMQLGYGRLNESGNEFTQNLGWNQNMFNQNFGFNQARWQEAGQEHTQDFNQAQAQFNQKLAWDKEAAEKQRSHSLWGTIGSVVGGGLGAVFGGPFGMAAGASLGGMLSDIRVKQEAEPMHRGLSEIVKLKPVSWEYNGKGGTAKGQPGVSVMAQDLEKVMPEAVTKVETKDFKDTRMISPMYILMASVNATKELHNRLRRLEAAAEAK